MAVSSVTVVIPHEAGIDAFAASDGRRIWRYASEPAPLNTLRRIAIAGNKVYVALTERTVGALDLFSGQLLWQSTPAPSPIDLRQPVIITDERVVVPLNDGLMALDIDGSVAWCRTYDFLLLRQLLPAMFATPRSIFLGGKNGVYAVSLRDGEILWSSRAPGEIGFLERFDDALIAVDFAGKVYRFAP